MSNSDGPRAEYSRRAEAKRAEVAALTRTDERIGSGRLLLAMAAIAGFIVASTYSLGIALPIIPAVAFVILVVLHERLRNRRRRVERALAYYEFCLARMDDKWAGAGNPGTGYLQHDHPFAADLDLFGQGSLFELLCAARTRTGEETLASWLLRPASTSEVTARQAAVKELTPHLDLREDLAALGAEIRESVRPEQLTAWGTARRRLQGGALRAIALMLSTAVLVTLGLWIFTEVGRWPFLIAVICVLAFWQFVSKRVKAVNAEINKWLSELQILARVLKRIEAEKFTGPRLMQLQSMLKDDATPASARIAELVQRVRLLDAQYNQFFALPAFLLLWSVHLAFVFENWREKSGGLVGKWLSATGEIEALCSLAIYAYEHPGNIYPELTDGALLYEGEALGHPLLPQASCVRNDLRLDDKLRVLIISGSNMSGKSTLLRTVGTNAVLALAGAPVVAKKLRLCPVALGATLRIQDSLQAGTSRFYAEIARLRQLVDIAGNGSSGRLPLLFLLDEILHGTNSHDRRIGARMVIRGLLDKGAIGLVTTHDLALAETVDALSERSMNVHFQDELKDGRMTFDYQMRPGIVQKSNALELMRTLGLPV
jgi:hypothetical protein